MNRNSSDNSSFCQWRSRMVLLRVLHWITQILVCVLNAVLRAFPWPPGTGFTAVFLIPSCPLSVPQTFLGCRNVFGSARPLGHTNLQSYVIIGGKGQKR